VTADRQAISITTDSTRKGNSKTDRIFNLLASLNLLEILTMLQTKQPNERDPYEMKEMDKEGECPCQTDVSLFVRRPQS
jgi:hypothetical protein